MSASNVPLRYDPEVPPDGRIELKLPLPAATHVTVLVLENSNAALDDLLAASVSSTDFWDNPQDDEARNDA
jgi:hypothetical protein